MPKNKKTEENKEEEEKPKEPEKPKFRFDNELALAFSFFDDSFNGLFKQSDLEEVLMYGNLGLTKQHITDIVVFACKHCHASHRGELCYSKLISEIPIDFEWESTPIIIKRSATVDAKTLCSVSDSHLRAKIDTLTASKADLVSKLNVSQEDYSKSQKTIEERDEKIKRLDSNLESKAKSLQERAQEVRDKDKEIRELKRKLEPFERAQREAEEKKRAEEKAKQEKQEAERKAKEAEKKAQEEAEKKAQEEAEKQKKEEEEAKAAAEAEENKNDSNVLDVEEKIDEEEMAE